MATTLHTAFLAASLTLAKEERDLDAMLAEVRATDLTALRAHLSTVAKAVARAEAAREIDAATLGTIIAEADMVAATRHFAPEAF